MKSIGYIVPYFGKLPGNMPLWLLSCSYNPTVDWIVITDDKTEYNYPPNVKVKYCSFEDIKNRIQQNFDITVEISTPWTLALFKPAYGEIFAEELKEYDFWGHCDVDVLWGNIRKFITDDILNTYDKIGFQGHSLLYRNSPEVNSRYKTIIDGAVSYREVFSGRVKYSFDENGMDEIYNHLNIPYYREINFAHMRKYAYGLSVGFLPKSEEYKNEHQIFSWKNGELIRHYIADNKIFTEEFMYIHFFCRPMKYKYTSCNPDDAFIIYADAVVNQTEDITAAYISKHSQNSALKYYAKSIWKNRKKITPKKIYENILRMVKYKAKNKN